MKQVATLSRYWPCIVAGALGMLNGCSGQPSAPVAATLQVSLSTPFNDDGALLFTVTGGRVDSVDALTSSCLASTRGKIEVHR